MQEVCCWQRWESLDPGGRAAEADVPDWLEKQDVQTALTTKEIEIVKTHTKVKLILNLKFLPYVIKGLEIFELFFGF